MSLISVFRVTQGYEIADRIVDENLTRKVEELI
jgi:hypothetical protein